MSGIQLNVMAYGFTTEYTASETKLSVSLGTRNLFLATKKTRNFTCVLKVCDENNIAALLPGYHTLSVIQYNFKYHKLISNSL